MSNLATILSATEGPLTTLISIKERTEKKYVYELIIKRNFCKYKEVLLSKKQE